MEKTDGNGKRTWIVLASAGVLVGVGCLLRNYEAVAIAALMLAAGLVILWALLPRLDGEQKLTPLGLTLHVAPLTTPISPPPESDGNGQEAVNLVAIAGANQMLQLDVSVGAAHEHAHVAPGQVVQATIHAKTEQGRMLDIPLNIAVDRD